MQRAVITEIAHSVKNTLAATLRTEIKQTVNPGKSLDNKISLVIGSKICFKLDVDINSTLISFISDAVESI